MIFEDKKLRLAEIGPEKLNSQIFINLSLIQICFAQISSGMSLYSKSWSPDFDKPIFIFDFFVIWFWGFYGFQNLEIFLLL